MLVLLVLMHVSVLIVRITYQAHHVAQAQDKEKAKNMLIMRMRIRK